MENTFLWAQILGFCAMCFALTAMQLKNPRNIIKCYIPVGFFWGTQYLLLGAQQGAIFSLSSVIKDTLLIKIKDQHVPLLITGFIGFLWVVGTFFIQSWYDLLPLIAGTIVNLGFLKRDNRMLVARASLTSQFCWFTYNFIVSSWMGMTCCILVGASCLIGMFRHENWQIGRCYRTFGPSLFRALFTIPNFRTYP